MSTSLSFVEAWAKAQQPKAPSTKNASIFYRNLEAELNARRAQHGCLEVHTYPGLGNTMSDFASADILGLGSSGSMRSAFMDELARNPNWWVSSSGSRLTFGNSAYMEELEREVASFHGAETALMAVNGGMANGAIFTAIPRPGDALVYDEFIHASVHDGMSNSLALCKKSFRHNSVDSFRDTLVAVRDSQPPIRNGARCVIVAVEGIYSMEGDVCPLQELVDAAKEVFPDGNAQFVIDEAHSHGVLGPKGAGLVSALGLEKEIAIRMHTLPKAMAAGGGKSTVSSLSPCHERVVSGSKTASHGVTSTNAFLSRDHVQQYCPSNAAKLREKHPVFRCPRLSPVSCNSGRIHVSENRQDTAGMEWIVIE
jgi:8-amino-7-oxononanoate synthase